MTKSRPDYTLLDHTADLGIKVRGTDLNNLFENAGKALIHLMVRGKTRGKTSSKKITVSGEDLPDLMVQWLGEILYLFEGQLQVVTSIGVENLTTSKLEAVVETVPYDPKIHEVLSEVKAVTYHQIEVADKGNHWEARVIFDL